MKDCRSDGAAILIGMVCFNWFSEEVRLRYALGGFGRFSVEMEVMSMFAGVHRLRNGTAVFSEVIGHSQCYFLWSKDNFSFQGIFNSKEAI